MDEKEYFIKNYPDACYGDKPLSPYWDYFQSGVEFGEQQTEKKIEEIVKGNAELKDRIQELLESCEGATMMYKDLCKAKEIISELLSSCFGYNSKTVNYEVKAKAEQFLKEVKK